MFWANLENFGKIDIFGPKSGRGGILPYSEILVTKNFWRPVTFPKIEIFKRKIFRPEFRREVRCEIILSHFRAVVSEIQSMQKKDFVNFGVFFAHSRNGP